MEEFLRSWSYLGIFVGIILTGLGFPMPEELPIVLAGAAAASDEVYWWLMLPVCIVAVVIGDSALYLVGRYFGARLEKMPFIRKHLLTPERLKSITDNFEKHGVRILLFARLTPGIRAPIFLTAGISRLPLPKFMFADAIYAIPGVAILFFLGYWFTDTIVGIIKNEAEKAKEIVILVGIVGLATYLIYRVWRKPMVEGSPQEMPPLVEQVTHRLEDVTHKLGDVRDKILGAKDDEPPVPEPPANPDAETPPHMVVAPPTIRTGPNGLVPPPDNETPQREPQARG